MVLELPRVHGDPLPAVTGNEQQTLRVGAVLALRRAGERLPFSEAENQRVDHRLAALSARPSTISQHRHI